MTVEAFQLGLYFNYWSTSYVMDTVYKSDKTYFDLTMNRFERYESNCRPDITRDDYLECQREAIVKSFLESNFSKSKYAYCQSTNVSSMWFYFSLSLSGPNLPVSQLDRSHLPDKGGLFVLAAGFQHNLQGVSHIHGGPGSLQTAVQASGY